MVVYLRLSIISTNRYQAVFVGSIQHFVGSDVLGEQWAALHLHAVDRLRCGEFYLDVLVRVLGIWTPTASCGNNFTIKSTATAQEIVISFIIVSNICNVTLIDFLLSSLLQ